MKELLSLQLTCNLTKGSSWLGIFSRWAKDITLAFKLGSSAVEGKCWIGLV